MSEKNCKPVQCNGEKCQDCSYCSKHEISTLKAEIDELKKETKRLKELCGKLKILLTTDKNRWRYGLLAGLLLVAICSTIADLYFQLH